MNLRKSLMGLVFGSLVFSSISAHAAGMTNFSGRWFGVCKDRNGIQRNHSMDIYQNGFQGVSINERYFDFGRTVETRVPNDPTEFPPSFNVAFEVVKLVNNATEMEYVYSGTYKDANHSWKSTMVTRFAVINSRLVTKLNDLTNGFTETCQYTKY